ncbi:hypothetical protein [Bradyrhizobium arachidis]|nr:hypothetical protein [Bradyrhizobium arachidis]
MLFAQRLDGRKHVAAARLDRLRGRDPKLGGLVDGLLLGGI